MFRINEKEAMKYYSQMECLYSVITIRQLNVRKDKKNLCCQNLDRKSKVLLNTRK